MFSTELISAAHSTAAEMRLMILAGGWSSESPGSTVNGTQLRDILDDAFQSIEIVDPVNRDLLVSSCRRNDFALNILYGRGGEDGTMQGFLSIAGLPASGPGVLPSAIGMNKDIFARLLKSWGYRVPNGCLLNELTRQPIHSLGLSEGPFILKPIDEGDSLGIEVLDTEHDVIRSLDRLAKHDHYRWRVEDFIEGPFGTIGVLETSDGVKTGKPIVFSLPEGSRYYDNALKNGLGGRPTIGFLSDAAGESIRADAIGLYNRLGCKGAVRFDYMLDAGNAVYLEVNTVPGMYPGSNLDLSFRDYICLKDLLIVGIVTQYQDHHRIRG